jgi:hypothetical protein
MAEGVGQRTCGEPKIGLHTRINGVDWYWLGETPDAEPTDNALIDAI